jgi:hypothetical protein
MAVLSMACTSPPAAAPPETPASPTTAAVATDPEPATALGEQAAATSEPGAPKLENSRYVYALGDRSFEIDPATGGRITAFRYQGRNVLAEPSHHEQSYGATFWTSPQKAWGWPPPKEIDADSYEAKLEGDKLTLRSKPSEKLRVAVSKTFTPLLDRGAVRVTYTMHNVGDAPIELAPWENTRVPPGGLTFYPADRKPYDHSTLTLPLGGGAAWLEHRPEEHKKGVKSFADATEGWIAHVHDGLMLVQRFEDVPRERQAPEEGEIEIYVDGNGQFVEVEHQGAYAEIAPGQHTSWDVTWYLIAIPEGVEVRANNPKLLELARSAK